VYWRRGAKDTLKSLDSTKFLHEQLASAFSVQHSPVWMDSSTTEYCHMLENHVGGPEAKISFLCIKHQYLPENRKFKLSVSFLEFSKNHRV